MRALDITDQGPQTQQAIANLLEPQTRRPCPEAKAEDDSDVAKNKPARTRASVIYVYATEDQKARIEQATALKTDAVGGALPVHHCVLAAALAAADKDLAAAKKGSK